MSKGIVLELQQDCLDAKVPVSSILRKAKAIAVKLDLQELSDWIDEELNGYQCSLADLPSHRMAGGAPKFWNPYNGWCPIISQDPKFSEILTTAYLPNPIAQLDEWSSNKGTLTYRYPHAVQEILHKTSNFRFEAVMHLSASQVISALDFVRNKILSWTLQLEKKNITGEGFSFKEDQKREAQMVTNHIYGGNIGVLGNVDGDANNSRFINSGNVDNTSLAQFLDQAFPAIWGLDIQTRKKVEPLLNGLQNEAETKADPHRVASLLKSLRSVLEGASGNLVASALLSALAG